MSERLKMSYMHVYEDSVRGPPRPSRLGGSPIMLVP